MEDYSIQVFFKRELSFLVSGEVQAMPACHLGPLQLEVFRRTPARMMIPPVGEQNSADMARPSRWRPSVDPRPEREINSAAHCENDA